MKKKWKLIICIIPLLLILAACIDDRANRTETDMVDQLITPPTEEESEKVPVEAVAEEPKSVIKKDLIMIDGDVTSSEIDLIINGEKLMEKVTGGLTKYQRTSESNYENALTVTIDDESYAPMLDDFGYHSIAELKEALSEYFTDEYIDTTPLFNQLIADEYDIPVYYKDFNGELYMWDGGDYFGEGAHYLWDNEIFLKTISRNDDSAVIEFCLYVKPMYAGNIWCTRYFTIIAGKISEVEHIKDDEPSPGDFIGSWAGYDEDGKFVLGYSFPPNQKKSSYYNGTIIEYYADGKTTNYDRHGDGITLYDFGYIMLDKDNRLCVETYSHDGLHEFTASRLKYGDADKDALLPTLTYQRVNAISIVDGKVVIE